MSEKALPPPYPLTDDAVPSMMDQLQSWVTLDQCKAHLQLLAHFSALHNACASRSELDHFAYLCMAERRYTDWMHALARAVGQDPGLANNAPIPPLDVALFWAAHMLSPIRYMDDMHRLFPIVPQMHQIQFPIQALVAHADGGLVNAESQYFWANYVCATEPYTLPAAKVLQAFNTRFNCPYCKSTHVVTDAATYVRFRLNGQPILCTRCHESVSVMQSCTSRLLDDLVAFRANPAAHRLPASHIDPDTRLFDPSVNRDQLTAMLVSHAKEWDALLTTYANLRSHPRDVQRATLNLDELLKPANGPVAKTHKRACKVIKTPVRNLYSRLIGSYQNIPVGPWSMDLVQAVLRQREFSDKMAHDAVQAQAGQFAMRAQDRYRKFLLLIRDHPNLFVVPTLDIDLGWHTHQLLGAKYVEFTQRLTGKVVNHDDAVGKGKLRNGVHETGVLWFKKFGEPYACDAKYHKYWTAAQVVPTVLFAPIVGPFQLYNASNHKQAINPAGDCAVHAPSSDPVQYKTAFAAFASTKSSARYLPPSKSSDSDPTKSSRLAPNAHPTPFLFFYSGCAPGGGSGSCEFSDARVGAATAAGGGGDVAGCGTVGGSSCGTGGCGSGGDGGGGSGCGGGGCGGGGCGGGS